MIQTSNKFLLFILYLSTKSANFQVRIERILATTQGKNKGYNNKIGNLRFEI